MFQIRRLLCTLSLLASLVSAVHAEMGEQLKIGDQVLQLNGAGVRTKTFVQIYESGLYLRKPTQNALAILDGEDLMAIRVRITSGFVNRASLMSSLQEGLSQSTNGKPESIARETEQLQRALHDEVKKNDIFDFVYVPAKGLHVVKNGKVKGVIPGLAFKKALFGIWLSDASVDKDLRQAMLSGKAAY